MTKKRMIKINTTKIYYKFENFSPYTKLLDLVCNSSKKKKVWGKP